jgi:uncharacterized membrane protein
MAASSRASHTVEAKVTKERVFEQAVGATIAYVAGLAVLWVWHAPTDVPILTTLLAGFAVAIPVAIAVDWCAFRRTWRDQFGLRPFRYSLPALPAFLVATVAFNRLSASELPERAVIAFAVCFGLIIVGTLASNWWWAEATKAPTGDIRGR